MSDTLDKAIAIAEQWREYAPYTVGYNEVDIFLSILRQAVNEKQFEEVARLRVAVAAALIEAADSVPTAYGDDADVWLRARARAILS